ncbi:unnamed protein product [Linum trigynum]|uniref:Uncharacterized protein n=1 Tax=Linum trigynum TaxID=586398 RepID=A0AAV2G5R1_9ROSI
MFISSRSLPKPIKEVPMKCLKVLKRSRCKKSLWSIKISCSMNKRKIISMLTRRKIERSWSMEHGEEDQHEANKFKEEEDEFITQSLEEEEEEGKRHPQ